MTKGLSFRQSFLEGFDDCIEKFKAQCFTPVCDDAFPEALKNIQSQGRSLIYGIQNLIDHAADLHARLNAGIPKQGCRCPVGEPCACHTP